MTIYTGNTVMINGEEVEINLAETVDLLHWVVEAKSWDVLEMEAVMRELCDRLEVNFDAYETYDDLLDALVDKFAKKDYWD